MKVRAPQHARGRSDQSTTILAGGTDRITGGAGNDTITGGEGGRAL